MPGSVASRPDPVGIGAGSEPPRYSPGMNDREHAAPGDEAAGPAAARAGATDAGRPRDGGRPAVEGTTVEGAAGAGAAGEAGAVGNDLVGAAGAREERSRPGEQRAWPGEVRPPSARLLERAPGERLAVPEPPAPLTDARMGRALAAGLLAGVIVVVAWLALGGALGLDWGLAVVALAGGWLVGQVVSMGAWGGERHVPAVSPRLLSVGLAIVAWMGGQVAVYLWTRITLPDSALTVGERIAATPFTDYFGGIAGPLDMIEVLLIVGAAWFASR